MARRSLVGGMARHCAARSAALAGWKPRALPASPPEPALNMTVLALSTRWRRGAAGAGVGAYGAGSGRAGGGQELGQGREQGRELGREQGRVPAGLKWRQINIPLYYYSMLLHFYTTAPRGGGAAG